MTFLLANFYQKLPCYRGWLLLHYKKWAMTWMKLSKSSQENTSDSQYLDEIVLV